MALETLKDVKSIGGFDIRGRTDTKLPCFIQIGDPNNRDYSIKFDIQNGPVKENGVSGCQVDTIVEAAKLIIEGLNKNYPCRENSMAITKLDEALMWMRERTRERETRGVEGNNER